MLLLMSLEARGPLERNGTPFTTFKAPLLGLDGVPEIKLYLEDGQPIQDVAYPARPQRADLTFKKARGVAADVHTLPFSAFIPPGDDDIIEEESAPLD